MYLETTITFWEDQLSPEGKDIRKKVNYHALCYCVNYSEAEALATEHGLEITSEDFEVGPIVELKVMNIYPDEEHEESYPWFKCNCAYSEFTDKGKQKERKISILVQAKDSAEASVKATAITKEWSDAKEVKTPKVSETQIKAILGMGEPDLPL